MRWSPAFTALVAATALAAAGCGGDRDAAPPAPPAPDPRLQAAFVGMVNGAIGAADKARELDRQAREAAALATRDIDRYDDDDDDDHDDGDLVGVVGGGVVGGMLSGPPAGLVGNLDLDPATGVRLLYKHGLRAYPSRQVDRQAAVVRALVADCLADDEDLAARVERAGGTTVTVRIDHAQDPPRIWASGASGLGACVKARLAPLPAAGGTFVTSIRIDG